MTSFVKRGPGPCIIIQTTRQEVLPRNQQMRYTCVFSRDKLGLR